MNDLRAHRAGDDAELAAAGVHRALARHPDARAEVLLGGDVVVVAVDGDLAGGEVGERAAQHVEHARHHQLAVGARERLRPADRLDVVGEQVGAFRQPGEVAVGQIDAVPLRLRLRLLDEPGADAVADAARAGMQHRPEAVGLVQAQLDEVVAGAERAQVRQRRAARELRMLGDDRLQALLQRNVAVRGRLPGLDHLRRAGRARRPGRARPGPCRCGRAALLARSKPAAAPASRGAGARSARCAPPSSRSRCRRRPPPARSRPGRESPRRRWRPAPSARPASPRRGGG